jgi:hypothetical protein
MELPLVQTAPPARPDGPVIPFSSSALPGISRSAETAGKSGVQPRLISTGIGAVVSRAGETAARPASADPDEFADKIIRVILDRLAAECERRGWPQWT